jgi:hypothetical protein
VTASVAPPAGTTLASCAFDIASNGNTTTLDGSYDAGAGVCRATLPDAIPDDEATAVARAVDSGGDAGTASATVTVGAVAPGPAVMLVDSGENRVVVAHTTPGTGRAVTGCTLAVRTAGSTGTFAALAAQLSGDGATCTAPLPRADYDPGAYEVRATATDDAGRTGTTTGAVSVGAPAVGAPAADDHALSATLAPAAGTPVTACAFTLTPAGGGDTTTVDGTVGVADATCAATAPAAVAAGLYTVTATARDANGDTGAAEAELRLGVAAPAPTPPAVALGDSGHNRVVVAAVAPSAGDTITACAIAVRPAADGDDDDFTPLDATYDAARGTCAAMLGSGAFDPGAYDVLATATDSSGDAATDRGTVRVVAPAVGTPAAGGRTITATADPAPGTPLVSCRIDVDPDGAAGPTTLSGTLEDGTCHVTLPDAVPAGPAGVTVTVTDANGDDATGTATVTVPAPGATGGQGGDGGGSTGGTGTGAGGTTSGTATPAPETPAPPASPASASVFATGSANDILLACGNGRLLLTDVVAAAGRVRIAGVAARALAGRTVTLRFTATGRTVATAKVRADGTFAARAPLPAKRLRASDRARYQALIGTLASQKLKLARRTYVTRLARASGGRVELRGRVTGPRARRAAAVVVQRLVGCHTYEKAATVKLSSKGRFVARVTAPRDAKAALYRVMTRVPAKAGGRATNRTYSLLDGLEVR